VPDCAGDGRRVEPRTFAVDVPAGVDHGSTLRLTGRGPAGPRGGPAGDLYVHLAVRPDSRFVREGTDVHSDMHVTMTQAALGSTIVFETLDGDESLPIPPGPRGAPDQAAGPGRPPRAGPRAGRSARARRGGHADGPEQEPGGAAASVGGRALRGDLAPDEGLMARLRSAFG